MSNLYIRRYITTLPDRSWKHGPEVARRVCRAIEDRDFRIVDIGEDAAHRLAYLVLDGDLNRLARLEADLVGTGFRVESIITLCNECGSIHME